MTVEELRSKLKDMDGAAEVWFCAPWTLLTVVNTVSYEKLYTAREDIGGEEYCTGSGTPKECDVILAHEMP